MKKKECTEKNVIKAINSEDKMTRERKCKVKWHGMECLTKMKKKDERGKKKMMENYNAHHSKEK